MTLRKRGFRSLVALAVSLVGALLFVILAITYFDGGTRLFLLYYYMPIVVPVVAYLLDRAERWRTVRVIQWAIDLPILGLSLTRAFIAVPLISGHALFLTYALLSTQSWVARGTAAIVLFQVSYLKLFVWYDMTLLGGIVLGGMAALCFCRLG